MLTYKYGRNSFVNSQDREYYLRWFHNEDEEMQSTFSEMYDTFADCGRDEFIEALYSKEGYDDGVNHWKIGRAGAKWVEDSPYWVNQ